MEPNLKFKQLRESLNLSQSVFAAKIGVSQGTIGDIERGRIGISKNVKSKIIEKLGIEIGYFDQDKETKSTDMKQGTEIGLKKGNQLLKSKIVPLTSKSKLDLIIPYLSLNDADLEYEMALEIDYLKDCYDDYQKLLNAIYVLKPPVFFKKKFTIGLPFSEYQQKIETEYSEDFDQNDEENSFTKIDKIFNLYKSSQDHCRYQLSLLIDYFNRYKDFFLDTDKVKNEL